jgi:hypothetical protein
MDGPAPCASVSLLTYHTGRLQSAIRSHFDPDGFRETASNHLTLLKSDVSVGFCRLSVLQPSMPSNCDHLRKLLIRLPLAPTQAAAKARFLS